ncbi:hypothetical protein M2152_001124 [Microbacteriaceae bacterium SG_E_30_P1]|uniref:DUF4166 domain-containing protein n=1 Tax=Antiquaquibacter oligotrophicus TaxID=2880260 RepID=A0ABT6KPB8_9MICO|nr:DUF4166 domain-containing protein [Antiquaquibacter oligotrophicus]MDH6180942.1 hypothetical protein [Antiquaquibacter oligotrophicus]UDF13355.1 DUF4166 domain-containing protein [Antiquaquibacter oligotrophicus]
MPADPGSPWRDALGEDWERLDPHLISYFGALTPAQIGRGRGVFDVVGTPRRWLWPLLSLLGAVHVLFPAWQHDVPFQVRNTDAGGGRVGLRLFEFTGRRRTMVDRVAMDNRHLTDVIGRPGFIRVELVPRVDDGALVLESAGVSVVGVPVPRSIAPRVFLRESWDRTNDMQHVDFRLEHPQLGLLYEYSVSFTYTVTEAA